MQLLEDTIPPVGDDRPCPRPPKQVGKTAGLDPPPGDARQHPPVAKGPGQERTGFREHLPAQVAKPMIKSARSTVHHRTFAPAPKTQKYPDPIPSTGSTEHCPLPEANFKAHGQAEK